MTTTVFEDSPKFLGGGGDYVRVTASESRVYIYSIYALAEEDVTIAMMPEQARALAQGIMAAAEKAEAHQ